jgi:transcriptional regulator with XRE-family HTH domain
MTETGRSPTAVRRALGQRLRAMRDERHLTVAQAADQVGFSQSKLTKIELAQVKAGRDDVLKLLGSYGETDPQQQALLLSMVRDGNRKDWWEGHLRLLPKFGSYLGLESIATTLQAYDTHLVHGLLQTPDYARAVIRGTRPELLEHEIDQLVHSRVRRQENLTRDDPPPLTLWSVMDEAVLHRPVGGRETMHAQLQRLTAAAELPNVTLLVMPYDLGAHAGLDGPLAIFQFETGTRPAVYVEGQAGNLYMEKDDDLRRCQQTINHILAAAPGPEQSLALIRQAAKEMKPLSASGRPVACRPVG